MNTAGAMSGVCTCLCPGRQPDGQQQLQRQTAVIAAVRLSVKQAAKPTSSAGMQACLRERQGAPCANGLLKKFQTVAVWPTAGVAIPDECGSWQPTWDESLAADSEATALSCDSLVIGCVTVFNFQQASNAA